MDKSRILMQKRGHRELTKGTPEELQCELKRSKIQKSCENPLPRPIIQSFHEFELNLFQLVIINY